MRERVTKKGNVFLLSATNNFAFFFFLRAVESGFGLDQNYIVEDELEFSFSIIPEVGHHCGISLQ